MEDLLAGVAQPEQDVEKKKPDKRMFGRTGAGKVGDANPFDDDDDEPTELEEVVVDTTGGGHEHAKAGSLEQFYVDVGRINTALADVRRSLTKLSSQFETSTTSTRSEDTKDLREAMQEEADKVSRKAHQCKAMLHQLEESNARAATKRGSGAGSGADRQRQSVTASLRKKLKELMGSFQDLRGRMQEHHKEVVQRRYYTVNGAVLDDDAAAEMIESGESEEIFKKAVLDQGRAHVMETVEEIKERHAAIQDLERSLLELHQIFVDMATLVDSQGEMLDNIEAQVGKSVEYVKSGTEALKDAKMYQKQSRKYMCCAIMMLLIILTIILVSVLKPWKSGEA